MLKNLFQAMSLRERFLLTLFIWVCLLVWGGSVMRSVKAFRSEFSRTGNELTIQKLLMGERETIEMRLQDQLQRLDPKKTYNSSQLVGKLDSFARKAKLRFDTNTPRTEPGDIFNIHTVRIQVRQAGIGELIDFDNQIKKGAPYLGLERVKLTSNKSDPRLLNAQFVISSFELKENAL